MKSKMKSKIKNVKNVKKSKKKANFLKRNKKYSKIMKGGNDTDLKTNCRFKNSTEKNVFICTVRAIQKNSK